MKKKILAFTLSFLLIVSLMFTSAMADAVGSFADLNLAISNASTGDTIKLEQDYKNAGTEDPIKIEKNLTLDLNGHTLDADGKSRVLEIGNSAVVTIKNGDICKGTCNDTNAGGIYVKNGTLNLENVNLYGNTATMASVASGFAPSAMKIAYGATVNAKDINVYDNTCAADAAHSCPVDFNGQFNVSGKIVYYNNTAASNVKRDLGPGSNMAFSDIKAGSEIWLYDSSLTQPINPGDYHEITNTSLKNYLTPTTFMYFHVDPKYSITHEGGKYYIHEHGNWQYSANGSVMTAKCGYCAEKKNYYGYSITIEAADAIYDGNTHLATLNEEELETWKHLVDAEAPEIEYFKYVDGEGYVKMSDGEYPKDAGTYKASITCGADANIATAEKQFSILPIGYNAASIYVPLQVGSTYTATVKLPALAGMAANNPYGSPVTKAEDSGKFSAIVSNGKLTVTAGTIAKADTLFFTVPVAGDGNHEDFTITVYIEPFEHEHNFGAAWVMNETHHWHECSGEGVCTAEKTAHIWNAYGVCSVCGYAGIGSEYRESAIQELRDAAKSDIDCPVIQDILKKAEIEINLCFTESEIKIVKAAALDEIATHLPLHAAHDVVNGKTGSISRFIGSLFKSKETKDTSTSFLLKGIFEAIAEVFSFISNIFRSR